MKLFIRILAILFCNATFAQYPYPDKDVAELIKNSTLAVQLLPETSDVEIEMNNVLKEAFSGNYEGKVKFFNPKDFAKVKKNSELKTTSAEQRNVSYAFLSQRESLSDATRFDIGYVDGSISNWVKGGSNDSDPLSIDAVTNFKYENIIFEYYDFMLTVFDNRKEKMATIITFVNDRLAKHDFLFLCQQINLLIKSSASGIFRADYINEKENIEILETKKLLLLNDYFTPEDTIAIRDNFGYDIEFEDFRKYQEIILAKTAGVAYIKIIYSFQHNRFMWLMIDAENGQILAINECGDFKFSGSYPANNIIKFRHLRYCFDENTQMLNNYYNK